MDSQSLWYYRDQLQRIIEESLEVSLVICKADLTEFSVAKIFDIFYQILPTGFVLNTGYWPFFNSIKKQSICVCGRYGMNCRHSRHEYHWIDLEKLANDNSIIFNNAKPAMLTVLESGIELTPITTGIIGYSLNMKMTFQYKRIERGRPRRRRDGPADGVFRVLLCSRYSLQKEYYPALHTIMFQPSPFFYETYGSHFPKLLRVRESFGRPPKEIGQTFYTVLVENMPPFTLVLQCVNVPIYQDPSAITPASLFYMGQLKSRKSFSSKSTQTEYSDDFEIWRYRELIGNLKPLWNDSLSTSCESLYRNPAAKLNDLFQTYVLNDELVDSPGAYHRTIKQEPVETNEEPVSTAHSHATGLQFDKAVSQRRSRRRLRSIQILNEATENGLSQLLKQNGLPNGPTTSYASAVKSSKPSQVGLICDLDTDFPKLGSYKKDPEFQWLDTQFPDLPSTDAIKQEKIDEDFDIAEEFISQENDRDNIGWRTEANQII